MAGGSGYCVWGGRREISALFMRHQGLYVEGKESEVNM